MPVIDSVSELTPEKALIFRLTHIDNGSGRCACWV